MPRKTIKKARSDRRFADPDSAPPIVSEKRVTFFLSEDDYTWLQATAAWMKVRNAELNRSGTDTPSGLAREGVKLLRAVMSGEKIAGMPIVRAIKGAIKRGDKE